MICQGTFVPYMGQGMSCVGWCMDFQIFDTLYHYCQLWSQMIPNIILKNSWKYKKKFNTVTCFIAETPFCQKSMNLAIFGELDYILRDHSNTNPTDIDWHYQNAFLGVSQEHLRVKMEQKIFVT